MTGPREDEAGGAGSLAADLLRREAQEAWHAERRRLALPSSNDGLVLGLGLAITAVTLAMVTVRVALLFLDRPAAIASVLVVGLALVLALLGVPLTIARRRRRMARAAVERARAARTSVCPRCRAPLLARGEDEAATRECGACGGWLLEAEGLIIAHTSDAEWRQRRWRGQARAGLARAPSAWLLSPMLWIGASVLGLGLLWETAAALGGAPLVEAPLGLDRQESLHPLSLEPASSARADASDAELGPPTRPRAPLWTGTSVLARSGPLPYHEPAVIVRVDPPHAFVVYASGESGWVHARELLAPHLAVGDEVEVREGGAFVRAELVRRLGTAVRVSDERGARWTSLARLRVRSDAEHEPSGADGRSSSEVPADAWVEARVDAVTRPGIVVEQATDGRSARVVFSDGSARWVPRGRTERQHIGPGTTLSIEGRSGKRIVAARIGDALAVVDARGRRSWTSLARVRR